MDIFVLLQGVFGTAAVILLLRLVFGYPMRVRRTGFRCAAGFAAAGEAALFFFYPHDPDLADLLQEALTLACTLVFPYLLLEKRKRGTFFLFALGYCGTTDYAISLLPPRWMSGAYVLLDAAILLLAVWLARTERTAPPDFLEQIPAWVFAAVFAADLSAYYGSMRLQDASYHAGVSIVLKAVAFVLIAGSMAYAARRLILTQRAEQQAAAQLEVQLRHYAQLVDKNRDVRAFRHDYENNLLSIGAILDAGKPEDALDYVRGLQRDVQRTAYTFATGNYLADAILSDKAAAAKESGIRLSFSGTVPQRGITQADLCTILCNLADNAVRGCLPCAPCSVEFSGRETEDRWLLTVRNPVKEKVVIRSDSIRTSKADRENHGFGLANVRRAAENYHGYLELECDDRCFTAEVGLMLNTEEKFETNT